MHAAHAGHALVEQAQRLGVHVDARHARRVDPLRDPLQVAADVAADLEHALGLELVEQRQPELAPAVVGRRGCGRRTRCRTRRPTAPRAGRPRWSSSWWKSYFSIDRSGRRWRVVEQPPRRPDAARVPALAGALRAGRGRRRLRAPRRLPVPAPLVPPAQPDPARRRHRDLDQPARSPTPATASSPRSRDAAPIVDAKWRRRLKTTLDQSYGRAAAPRRRCAAAIDAWIDTPCSSVADMNIAFIRLVAGMLGFAPEWRRSSEIGSTGQRSERVLDLLHRAGARTYLCARGSYDYMDEDGAVPGRPTSRSCSRTSSPQPYPQRRTDEFVSHLSVLDALFEVGADETAPARARRSAGVDAVAGHARDDRRDAAPNPDRRRAPAPTSAKRLRALTSRASRAATSAAEPTSTATTAPTCAAPASARPWPWRDRERDDGPAEATRLEHRDPARGHDDVGRGQLRAEPVGRVHDLDAIVVGAEAPRARRPGGSSTPGSASASATRDPAAEPVGVGAAGRHEHQLAPTSRIGGDGSAAQRRDRRARTARRRRRPRRSSARARRRRDRDR